MFSQKGDKVSEFTVEFDRWFNAPEKNNRLGLRSLCRMSTDVHSRVSFTSSTDNFEARGVGRLAANPNERQEEEQSPAEIGDTYRSPNCSDLQGVVRAFDQLPGYRGDPRKRLFR